MDWVQTLNIIKVPLLMFFVRIAPLRYNLCTRSSSRLDAKAPIEVWESEESLFPPRWPHKSHFFRNVVVCSKACQHVQKACHMFKNRLVDASSKMWQLLQVTCTKVNYLPDNVTVAPSVRFALTLNPLDIDRIRPFSTRKPLAHLIVLGNFESHGLQSCL